MYIRCKCKALIPFGNILANCVKIAIIYCLEWRIRGLSFM